MSDTELEQQEKDVLDNTAADFSPEQRAEFDKLAENDPQDEDDGFYKGGDEPKKRRFSGRKKKAAILGISLAAGGFATFGILSGPFQFLQAAKMLTKPHFSMVDSFGNGRSTKFIIYSFFGKSAQGRLGVVGNRNADKWEKRLNEKSGLRSVYSQGTPQRLIGYEITDPDKARTFTSDLDRDGIGVSNDLKGVDINGNPVDGVRGVKFERADFDIRRSVTRTALRSIGVNRVSGRLGSRLHIKRGGVSFHPLNRLRRNADISLAEYRRQKQEERDNRIRTGDPDAPDTPGSTLKTKLLKTFNTLKGPTAAVVAICAVKDFSKSIDQQSLENNKQLIRMGMQVVTVASQIQSGQDLSMYDLRELSESFYDEKDTQTSWRADDGIKWENDEEMTGVNYVEEIQPGTDKKPQIFDIADDFNPVGIGVACNKIQEAGDFGPIAFFGDQTNAALKAVGIDVEKYTQMAIDYFSSGAVDAAAQGAKAGGIWNIGTRLAAGDQMRGTAGVALTDGEGTEVKTEAKIETTSFEKVEFNDASLYDRYANVFEENSLASQVAGNFPNSTEQVVNGFANIPTALSNLAATLLGRNKVSAATTGTYEYSFPLYGFSLADQQDDRFENPYENEDELDAFLAAADAAEQACAAKERKAGRKPYPTCETGYSSLKELNTGDSDFLPDDGDGKGDDGSDHPANGRQCFGMEVSESGDLIYGDSPDISKIPGDCATERRLEFLRYRFYLADTVTGHTLRCYEGEERSCQQLGFGSGQASGTSGSGTSADTSTVGNTASTPCAPGTTDAGETDGWSQGKKYRIRLCEIPGFASASSDDKNGLVQVNSTASAKWLELFKKSQTDNIGLTAINSFRTNATQEYLDNCDTTNLCNNGNEAAAPGFSNHQIGFAVDIDINTAGKDPSLTTCKANPDAYPKYKWLAANAPALGISATVNSECWHWSVGGN